MTIYRMASIININYHMAYLFQQAKWRISLQLLVSEGANCFPIIRH